MTSRRNFLQRSAGLMTGAVAPRMLSARSNLELANEAVMVRGQAFGSYWQLSLAHSTVTEPALAVINSVVELIDQLMSPYRTDSEISNINRSASGIDYTLSAHCRKVIAASLEVAQASHGAFDPTVGPLVNRYGFGPITGNLRSHYTDISLRGDKLTKTGSATTLDLCGIAKGYALDLITARLESAGYTNFLLEMGGELKSRGSHPSGRDWRVGIESPVSYVLANKSAQPVVSLKNMAIATSGIAHNSYYLNNQRYSHLVSRITSGRSDGELYSVSVYHESAIYADAWSTALFALGWNRGLQCAHDLGLHALFIQDNQNQFDADATGYFGPVIRTM